MKGKEAMIWCAFLYVCLSLRRAIAVVAVAIALLCGLFVWKSNRQSAGSV